MWGLHLRLHVLLRANGALPKLKGQRLNGRIRRRGWHDDCRRHCFGLLSAFLQVGFAAILLYSSPLQLFITASMD